MNAVPFAEISVFIYPWTGQRCQMPFILCFKYVLCLRHSKFYRSSYKISCQIVVKYEVCSVGSLSFNSINKNVVPEVSIFHDHELFQNGSLNYAVLDTI